MVVSAIAAVTGAIMYWAVSAPGSQAAQNSGFRLSTMGVILMIAGAVGFITSLMIYMSSNRALLSTNHRLDRTTVDEFGRTTELHQQER
jgi:fatty-acid desaturase